MSRKASQRQVDRRSRRRVEINTHFRPLRFEPLEARRLLATFADANSTLQLTLGTGQQVSIVSTGTSYILSLGSTGTWTGPASDPNVIGSGLNTLTVTSAGIAVFTGGIDIADTGSGGGDGVTFGNSASSGYSNSFVIVLTQSSSGALAPGLSFSGSTIFAQTASLIASTNGDIIIGSGANLTTSGGAVNLIATGPNAPLTANGNLATSGGPITLQATGAVTVGPGATVNSGSGTLTLAADVTSSGAGDDGLGTLSIGAGATVVSSDSATHAITLRGADVNIDTSSNPALVGAPREPLSAPAVTVGYGFNDPQAFAFDAYGNFYVANLDGQTVTKFAPGSTTPEAILTELGFPSALAFDSSGDLFVANKIQAGTVSEFRPGSTTPSNTLAGLNYPTALAFDASGNLFVVNGGNGTVSKFAPGGTTPIATLTGFNAPDALAFDASGNLFVVNNGSASVSKFAPGSTTRSATLTGLNDPDALAFDPSGNLFVVNAAGTNGTVSEFAPGGTTPIATLTGLNSPSRLAFDPGGELYVSNAGSNSVSEFAPGSTVPTATITGLNEPYLLALDSRGDLYVDNAGINTMSEFAPGGLTAIQTFGSELSGPSALAFGTHGNLYVANLAGNTVSEFAPEAATPELTLTGLGGPTALAFGSNGDLYVANKTADTVDEFPLGNNTPSATLTGLGAPVALLFDGSGTLYVANSTSGTVSEFGPGSTTPTATLTGLAAPDALAFDAAGDLYVANNSANTVSEFAPGATTPTATLSGLSGPDALTFDAHGDFFVANSSGNTVSEFIPGATTPTITLSGLNEPEALAFDSSGNLYVANAAGNTLSEFNPGRTTPSGTFTGLADPVAMAFDAHGNLYVANNVADTISGFATGGTIPTAGGVMIQSSIESRPMQIGGSNNAALPGINLTSTELAQILTTSGGAVTIGDTGQTGSITFSTAMPATTAGAALAVVQSIAGPGQIILDDGAGSATALNGNGGSVSLTAGAGGIVALSPSDNAAEIGTMGATVTLLTAGPIGSSGSRIQFADNANTAQQNVGIGSAGVQPTSAYLDGLGSLTLASIDGGTANTTIDVTARKDLVVAPRAILDSGTGTISLGADLMPNESGDDGVGTLSIETAARVISYNSGTAAITLRGADVSIETGYSPAAVGGVQAPVVTTARTLLTGVARPFPLAFDSDGNLYVANATGTTISKFAPGASTPTATLTGLNKPVAFAFDSAGDLFVVNRGSATVSEFTPGSATPITTLVGLDYPTAIAIDSNGNAFVANQGNGTISEFTPGGTTPMATLTGLNQPSALAFDSSGNLYVANGMLNGTVSEFAPGSIAPTATLTGLDYPRALAFDSEGNLYVANDVGSGTVSEFAAGSTTPTATLTGLDGPGALAFDSFGNLYVANTNAATVSRFAPGSMLPTATLTGLANPDSLAFDSDGNLYVANSSDNTVSEFANGSTPTTGGLVIRSSIESRPMQIGGTDDAAVQGINLTSAELAQLFTTSTGTVTIGDGQQTGNITLSTATPATTADAALNVVQAIAGPGQIVLDEGAGGGTALNGNGGVVNLFAGIGGVQSTLTATGLPLVTAGFSAATALNLALGFAPDVGEQMTIVDNTLTPALGNPISGTFSNLPQGGTYTTSYLGIVYTLQADYQAGDGNDLVLTLVSSSSSSDASTGLQLTESSGTSPSGNSGAAAPSNSSAAMVIAAYASTLAGAASTNALAANQQDLSQIPGFVVVFSANMATSGAGDVTNVANWQLTRNAQQTSNSVSQIAFAYNPMNARYEATLTLASPLVSGNYVLTALGTIEDAAGLALDGANSGTPGSNFVLKFSIAATTAVGSTSQVSGTSAGAAGTQVTPKIAINAAGDYVVAWISEGQNGTGAGVYAERYNALGPVGSAFLVDSDLTATQSTPAVAIDAGGDFVVTWDSDDPGVGYSAHAQRYDRSGNTEGGEFAVSAASTANISPPSVSMDSVGDFIITWGAPGLCGGPVDAQLYDSAGVANGAQFQASPDTNSGNPIVAMDAQGDFVIAWLDNINIGSLEHVDAQRFSPNGTALGSPLQVDTLPLGDPTLPSVAMDPAGDFVVAWGQSSTTGIYAQRFNAAGLAQGGQFEVGTTAAGAQSFPSVAIDAEGDFAITWQVANADGTSSAIAQFYNSQGEPQGSQLAVSQATANAVTPQVAMEAGGDFDIAFNGQDTNQIELQAYGVAPPVPLVVGAFVSGTAWNASYLSMLDAAGLGSSAAAGQGFELASGPNQLTTMLPWNNVNEISIAFNEPVNVSQNSLTLYDSTNTAIPSSGFSYNATANLATWHFATALPGNKYVMHLAANTVTNLIGTELDGAWTAGVSTFADGSGNGAPGGDFNFYFDVLAGDANDSGAVSNGDVLVTKLQVGATSTASNYKLDVNASGSITNGDVLLEKLQVGSNIKSFADSQLPVQSASAESPDDDLSANDGLSINDSGSQSPQLPSPANVSDAISPAAVADSVPANAPFPTMTLSPDVAATLLPTVARSTTIATAAAVGPSEAFPGLPTGISPAVIDRALAAQVVLTVSPPLAALPEVAASTTAAVLPEVETVLPVIFAQLAGAEPSMPRVLPGAASGSYSDRAMGTGLPMLSQPGNPALNDALFGEMAAFERMSDPTESTFDIRRLGWLGR